MTQQEILEARKKYGIPPEGLKKPIASPVSNQSRVAELQAAWGVPKSSFHDDMHKAVPGSETAVTPARSADGGLGLGDLAKTIPNALGDIWNLVKEGTYGTAKKIVHDIPVAAYDLVKEQGIGNAIKNTATSLPGTTLDTAASLIPQSAKELANFDALKEIPAQFKAVVDQNGGSYAKALLETIKAAPESIPDAVVNYANQIDRARQSVENHPVNEFLGYLGLKALGEHGATTSDKGTLEESFSNINKTTVEGGEAGGKGSPVIEEKPKGSFRPEINKMFQEEGIKPPISAITDSAALRGGEALASKGVFGAQVRDTVLKAVSDLEKKTNDIITKIKPGKVMSDEVLGQTVKEGLLEYQKDFKLTEDRVYGEFSKVFGKSQVPGLKTKAILDTLIKEQSMDQFRGIDPRLSKMFDRLTGRNNPEIKALQDNIDEFKSKAGGKVPPELETEMEKLQDKYNKPLTFSELKETRTAVGEALDREPANSSLKRLYGALSDDMQTAVKQVGLDTPFGKDAAAAAEALDKLNEGYRTGKAKIESNISQSIGLSNPESVAKNIIKRNSAETLKLVREMIGPERFSEVQKYFLRDILENSIKKIQKKISDSETVIQSKFDVSKLKQQLTEYDLETLKELLTSEQLTELNDSIKKLEKFDVMGESLKTGQKMAEGSQTAFLTKLSAFTGALFSGHIGIAIPILMGDLALKTLFTSKFGRRLLTEGLTMPNLKALKDLKNLSEANKQLIISNMRTQSQGKK